MAKAYGTSGDDDDGIGFTFKLNQIINALNGVSYFFPYHVLSYNRDRSIVSHCNNLIVASFGRNSRHYVMPKDVDCKLKSLATNGFKG